MGLGFAGWGFRLQLVGASDILPLVIQKLPFQWWVGLILGMLGCQLTQSLRELGAL